MLCFSFNIYKRIPKEVKRFSTTEVKVNVVKSGANVSESQKRVMCLICLSGLRSGDFCVECKSDADLCHHSIISSEV